VLTFGLGIPFQMHRRKPGQHGYYPSPRNPRAQPLHSVHVSHPKARAQDDLRVHCNHRRGFNYFEKLREKKYRYTSFIFAFLFFIIICPPPYYYGHVSHNFHQLISPFLLPNSITIFFVISFFLFFCFFFVF
jgi:hypothetical protein